jgi:hypothetical protein
METSVGSLDFARLIADQRNRIRYLTGNGGGGRGALTMHEFADRSGLSVSFLSKFVRGELPNPMVSSLIRLDTALAALETDTAVMQMVEVAHAKHQARMEASPS